MLLPKIRTEINGIGIDLFVQFPDISDYPLTFLSADENSGQTTISVDSGLNFSSNDYVLIGNSGEDHAEILQVSSSTASTIVVGATSFAHERGTKVQIIPYNQIVVSRSTDGITYNALSATDIDADANETFISRTTDATTDYYKARFYNSTTTLYSQYSDIVTGTGFADNSVYSIKQRALDDLGEKINIETGITDKFLNDSLWEGRRELDQDPRVLRWSFRTQKDAILGNVIAGTNTVTIPSDLRDPNTQKNILNIRIGKSNYPVIYQDWDTFNENYWGVAHTTLNGALLTGDTSIVLTDSGDFDDEGTISIAGTSVSDSIDDVSYTDNTLSTNTLSGVTGIQTAGHSTGIDVWQNSGFGLPQWYTIDSDNGKIKFSIPFDDIYAGENIYSDYYKELPVYDSDGDNLDEPEYDLFVNFLKWKIKSKKSNGTLDPTKDPDYVMWEKRKADLINKEMTGQSVYLTPSE